MKDDTLVVRAGREDSDIPGPVNPPVYHVSTVLFPTLASLLDYPNHKFRYGRRGTPTTFALEDAATALEGGAGASVTPSGVAALGMALLSCVEAGDHILVTDALYGSTRKFCDLELSRLGVETEYYDPLVGAGIAKLIRPNTRLVLVESPGTGTFEVQDLPAIAEAAHDAGATVIADNTWSGGYFCKPLSLGADMVVQAATKYIVGHSDAMMGLIVCNEATLHRVRQAVGRYGICAGPDDIYLALRGMRTMAVRLRRHHENGLVLARWLKDRPEVTRVMHPGLADDPGHELWKRDFSGAGGLFGFEMKSTRRAALAAMLDNMELFGMGYSWGGYESLLIPTWPYKERAVMKSNGSGQYMRIHVGLEDPEDLIADLQAGFDRLGKA